MRIPLLTGLALCTAIALSTTTASAQTVLFNFEGVGGDTEGWEPDVAPDGNLGPNAQSLVRAVDSKAVGQVNGVPSSINAFNGTWLLEAVPNRPIGADEFRGMKYTWDTPQDWTSTPLLKVAASMQADGPTSELHQYRIRVISGTGAAADTTEVIFDGFKSLGAGDGTDFNTFVNDWEVLEFDLSSFAGLATITSIETAGRHADDANSGGTPIAADVNWGGLVHLDYVTVEAGAVSVEGAPGLAFLGDVYPNPAASGATLALAVETAQDVAVTVHDVLGREVAAAFDGSLTPGATSFVRIGTADLAPGRYLVRVQGETFAASRGLSVVR